MIPLIIVGVGAAGAVAAVVFFVGSGPIAKLEEAAQAPSGAGAPKSRWGRFVARRLDRASGTGLAVTIGLTAIFGAALVAGVLLDAIDADGIFAEWDEAIAEFGASERMQGRSDLLLLVTELGGTVVAVAAAVVAAAFAWWRHRKPAILWFMASVVIGQSLLNNGLKWLVMRERPDVLQLAPWAGSSFPSGHSAAAAAIWAAIAVVLSIGSPSWLRALYAAGAVFIAVSVGATRALLGVHWLTDVLAGLAVGWGWFIVCYLGFGRRLRGSGTTPDNALASSSSGAAR